MYFLSKYQDIQSKMRQEVLEIIQDENQINEEIIQRLVYSKCILNETLRLRPPVICIYYRNLQ